MSVHNHVFSPAISKEEGESTQIYPPFKILSGNYRLAKGSNEKKPKDLQKGHSWLKKPEATYKHTV